MEEKILDILYEASGNQIEDTELDLFSEEIIDSFIIINLVVQLEEAFDISISVDYITYENFCSVRAIMGMVKRICEGCE